MKRKIVLGAILLLITPLSIAVITSENTNDKNFLNAQLANITKKIEQKDDLNPEVSKVPVGWHLDHVLLVIGSIYDKLEASDPEQYESDFNIQRTFVFSSGIIPRGVGKTPDRTRPSDIISIKDIENHLSLARVKLNKFDELNENSFFKHTVFGNLNKQQAKRLIEVHTNHHLKIVRDILDE